MKYFVAILFFLTVSQAEAQISAGDGLALREMLLAHVNNLRDSLGLEPLKEQVNLQKAALDHSKYMAKIKELTHEEKGPGRTVAKRVRRAGSRDFDIVGENVLYSEVKKFKFKKSELEELARSMYLQWRNSPGHYRNMIQPQYEFGDIGIAADTRTHRIYATQVFGAKGMRVEGQLSPNGFGVKSSREPCEDRISNLITNMCNGVHIRNDSVFFMYHDISRVKEAVSGPQDGFAIDLVDRDQMPCDGPNLLDMSKVYDGIMLKPLFRDEFLQKNTAEGENRIIVCLGVIPEKLRGKSIGANLIHIKNKTLCQYYVPSYTPSRAYVMEPFQPKMIQPNVKLSTDVIYSEELEFNFERGSVTSSNQPQLHIWDEDTKIHSLQILSYSSVEGSTERNIKLHHDRAKYIEKFVKSQTPGQQYPSTIDAQENWRKMDFQLRYLFADSLLELSQAELKSLIASGDQSLDWDKLLFEQRSSLAFVNYEYTADSEEDVLALPFYNLTTAIVKDNMPLANRALYEMYNSNSYEEFVFDTQVFDALLKRKELVQNAAAVISKVYRYDRRKATMFVHAWALRLNELDQSAKENVLHLYSLLGYELVQEWDVSAKRLSNVIHPKRLEGLINTALPAEIMLNANLTFVYYYGHTLEREGLERSFSYVKKYMDEKSFTQGQIENLVLFFNDWSRYDLTNKYLIKSWDEKVISEENTFILAHTLSRYQSKKYYDKYLKVMERALELDRERFCAWLDEEFQILRDPELKMLFCENCE